MKLVERDDHLALLDRLAARTRAGQGQAAIICGPPATGRTTLLHELTTRAGMLPLTAVGAPAERDLPCGIVHQLLDGAPLPATGPSGWTTLLTDATRLAGEPGGEPGGVALLELCHTLCLRLQALAADRPLLVAVDDIGYADAASLDFLRQLVRRCRTARIMVALTDDSDRAPAAADFRAELYCQPHTYWLTVGPLSRAGVYELVARRIGATDAAGLADSFFDASGGNPLLLAALLDRLTGTADRFDLAVLGCLQRGPAPLLAVARATAALGADGRWVSPARLLELAPNVTSAALTAPDDTFAAAAGSAAPGSAAAGSVAAGSVAAGSVAAGSVAAGSVAAGRALRSLTGAGLLDGGVFRNPAAAAAVLSAMPPGERARLHRRAAAALAAAGAPAPVVARHLHDAGQPVPGWAMDVLVEAAAAEVAAGRTGRAGEYLDLAGGGDPGPAATVRARLVEVAWPDDPLDASRHLAPLAAAALAGHLPAADEPRLVRLLLWHGRTGDAAEVLHRVRLRAGPGLDHLERWLAYTHPPLACPAVRDAGPCPRAGSAGAAARPADPAAADPWLAAAAGLADLCRRGAWPAAAEHAERLLPGLATGRDSGWAEEAAAIAVGALVDADRLDAAAGWCDRMLASARRPGQRAAAAAARSRAALALGDLPGTVRYARAALTERALPAWGVAAGPLLACLIHAYARLGRCDEEVAAPPDAVATAMTGSRHGLHHRYARACRHLAASRYHAALAGFLACGDTIRSWGLDAAGIVAWRAGAAEAYLRLGDRDQAVRLLDESPPGGTRSRGLAARLRAATGPPGQRVAPLIKALALFEACGDRYEQARTLAELSSAYLDAGQCWRARTAYRQALVLAQACQARPLCDELLAAGRAGISPAGTAAAGAPAAAGLLAALTSTELSVATLAAMGYTNRQIAGRLFVTTSTVEQHLTRVYRKLRVSHRRELPGDLAWQGLPGHPPAQPARPADAPARR